MKPSVTHAEPLATASDPHPAPRTGLRWTPPGEAPDWALQGPDSGPDDASLDPEADADRAAAQVLRLPPPGALPGVPAAPGRVPSAIRGGQPLAPVQRARFERGFGVDLGHVRLHADGPAARSARSVGARAYTLGADIVFGPGQYRPGEAVGDHLLAHELAHVVQQTAPALHGPQEGPQQGPVALRMPAPVLARSVDEWLAGSVDLARYQGRHSDLQLEIDELQAWRERQTASSPDTQRIDEVLDTLRRLQAQMEQKTVRPAKTARGKRQRGGTGQADTQADGIDTPLPARLPRVLAERRSVAYADADELRAEFDLVMQWLARSDLPGADRQLLQLERTLMQPLLQAERRRTAAAQQQRRLQAALTPDGGSEAESLAALARAIQGITADPADPRIAYIHHRGERLAMGAEQAQQLRDTLATTLSRAIGQVASGTSYYWSRYEAQKALNSKSPVIAGISGWLANVRDPRGELRSRCDWVEAQVPLFKAELAAGALVAAAARLPQLEQAKLEIGQLASAYWDGLIEGAGIAAHRLELTRDASFTIAASIGAVLAAPVVAGAVAYGVGAVGVTGTVATVATGVGTTLGTGAVVGTGMATLRGGSAAVGQLSVGGSRAQVTDALLAEGKRGLREGFIAGATAGAARFIGPALGVGKDVAMQTARRIAAESVVNGLSAMADVLLQGGSVEQAAQAGAIGAVSAIPGALLGGSNNPLVRGFVGPFASAATAYAAARANGASPQDALEAAGIALTTALAMARAAPGGHGDADLQRRGETWARDLHTAVAPAAKTGAAPASKAPARPVVPAPVEPELQAPTPPGKLAPVAEGALMYPADPANPVEAFKLYKARIAADPAREVALVYNHTLDQWAVVQGGPHSVSMASLRAAGWAPKDRTMARHSHPVAPDGRTRATGLVPSGDGADLSVVRLDAGKRGATDANLHMIDVVTARGPDRTLVLFDPATRRWTVDYPGGGPGGGRGRLSFGTAAAYHDWFKQRFGFDPGARQAAKPTNATNATHSSKSTKPPKPTAQAVQEPQAEAPQAPSGRGPMTTQGEAEAQRWRDMRPDPNELQALQAELGATGPITSGALLQLYRHGSRATVVKYLRADLHSQAQDPANQGVLTLGEHRLTLDPTKPAGPQIDAFIKNLEGAHFIPQSVSKKLPEKLQKTLPGGKANPDDALVVLTDKATHTRMDQPWKDAFDKLRKSGEQTATGQQVFDEVADGIRRTEGLSEAERASRVARLGDELRELGIQLDGKYSVPMIVKWWEWRTRRGKPNP